MKEIFDICAIVPAAGFGIRMETKCPKQYISIGGKTILEHSVSALLANSRIARIIIVIAPGDTRFSKLSLSRHPKITVVNGGVKRANSVLAGIQAADKANWVIVHDAVRPCLRQEDLVRLLDISKSSRVGGILGIPARDTMKQTEPNRKIISCTISRSCLWHALTPQYFPYKLLQSCLTKAIDDGVSITDEASALEYCGFYPELVEGRSDNIKVTRPEDLFLAGFYLDHLKHTE